LGDQELQHRYNPTPTSVVMVDVDGLKAVNDGSGHAAGDELLRRCARLLADSVRATDVAARIGGDEFGVLMRHTNVEQAQEWLERLTASRVGCSDEGPLLHWSIGCASAEFHETIAAAAAAADREMYEMKSRSRAARR
jgi:diguanylate cyclase (GGDEF)-like protein